MEQTFRAQRREAHQQGSMSALLRLWLETIRDVFTTAPREHLAILRQDVGYAVRALRRAPVFAGAVILTLAVGVSGVVAVFTIINAFMFRPLPVDRPGELMSISTRDRHAAVPHGLSFADLQDYRTGTGSAVFADLLGYTPQPAVLDAGLGVERVTLEAVTDNYFSMLGVQPAVGRLIQPNEGRARGDAPVLVLAHEYWQPRFAAIRRSSAGAHSSTADRSPSSVSRRGHSQDGGPGSGVGLRPDVDVRRLMNTVDTSVSRGARPAWSDGPRTIEAGRICRAGARLAGRRLRRWPGSIRRPIKTCRSWWFRRRRLGPIQGWARSLASSRRR